MQKNYIWWLVANMQISQGVACLFSSPEPKAQVHYCDHVLSVVRLSSLTFHIFDFSS